MKETKNLSEKDFIIDIFKQMQNNPDLAGRFYLVNNGINWELFDGFLIRIECNYIVIDRFILKKTPDSIMHWHPEDDEMYDNICALGTKGNVTVIKKTLFGEAVLYMGPKRDCKYTKKWLLGKYYFLYAE